ncbi:MAG: glycosyltransferase family 1 protein [Gemmatimonadetes bacterium]|nr:glycosyltransferase family 1 protein [Gemmatimonadota bacterium]
MPKICHVIARLNVGGPAVHVIQMSHHLRREGLDVSVVKGMESATEGDLMEMASAWGVEPIVLRDLGREISPLGDLKTLWKLARLLRSMRPDLVHTHTAKAGTLGRIAARLAGVKAVVHTFHGHVLSGYFSKTKSAVILWIERILARSTTRVVTLTEIQRREIVGLGIGGDRVVTLPLGMDLTPYENLDERRGRLRLELAAGDRFLVGLVARLVPIKRVEDFIEAAQLVTLRTESMRFLIVGDGELRVALERKAHGLGLGEDQLSFLGFRDDLETIYADLDLLVLCSANEGSPVAIMEAMASGVPVVATAVGGVPDLVADGETGVLVPAGDPHALAEAIRELHAAPELRRRLAAAGRERIVATHGLDRVVPQYATFYRELITAEAGA